MAGIPLVDNAVGWVQLRLRGGPKSAAIKAGGYAAIIGAIILVSIRVDPKSTVRILSMWTKGLFALQVGVLVLMGCSAIRNSVQKDVTTRMLESHRLSPITGFQAMVGYLSGATSETMSVAAVNLILGAVVSAGSGVSVGGWLLANAILVWFALCLWAGAAFFGFTTRIGFGVLISFAVILGMGGGVVLVFLPGLMLLVSPAISNTVLAIFGASTQWPAAYPISLLAQFALGAIFFVGAMRKYRRDDLVAIGPWVGLCLVAGWVLLSVIGIVHWDQLTSSLLDKGLTGRSEQVIASTVAAMILAIVPVAGATRIRVQWERRRELNDPALGRKPVPPVCVALVCAAVCLWLPLGASSDRMPADTLIRLALLIAMHLLAFSALLRISYRAETRGFFVGILWLAFVWAGPMIGEFVHFSASDLDQPAGRLAIFSPVGTLTALLRNWPLSTTPGLVMQALLAFGLLLLSRAPVERRTPVPPSVRPRSGSA